MFKFRHVLAVVILLSVIALGIVIWRHVQQQSPKELLSGLPEDIDLALSDLHYTQNEGGRRSWSLNAAKAEYQRDSSQVKLDVVDLVFYQAGQFGETELRANEGQLEQSSRQIDVWGNVELTTERGDQLFTDRLHYDDQLRRLSTDSPIRYRSSQLELTGIGMQLDIDQGRLLVKERVRVELNPAAGKENGR